MELLCALALLFFASASSMGTQIIVNRIAQKKDGKNDPNGALDDSDDSITHGIALALGGYLAVVLEVIVFCGVGDPALYVFMFVWPLQCCLNAWQGFKWRRWLLNGQGETIRTHGSSRGNRAMPESSLSKDEIWIMDHID
jgi:hypothetical protein